VEKLATGKLLASCGWTCYGEITNLLRTCHLCYGLFSDTMGKSPTCYGLAIGKLWGNWTNGFWPLPI